MCLARVEQDQIEYGENDQKGRDSIDGREADGDNQPKGQQRAYGRSQVGGGGIGADEELRVVCDQGCLVGVCVEHDIYAGADDQDGQKGNKGQGPGHGEHEGQAEAEQEDKNHG